MEEARTEGRQLKRGLFGYKSKSVDVALAERDRLLAEAGEQARAAEAQVLESRSEAERLKTQLAQQVEQLRALGAEIAELKTDRDAARRDFQVAVADTERLRVELTAIRRELETVRHDVETADDESETASDEADSQDERLRAAEELTARRNDEIALLEQELGAVRRAFLIQSQRARSAEARVEELEAEVRSVRAELEAGLSAAIGELEAARTSVEEAAARPAPDPSATAEERSAVRGSARGTTARIMNGPRPRVAEKLRETGRASSGETLAENARLGKREDLAPVVGLIRSTIEDARERAAGIEARVDEAVAPLTEAITELSDWQTAFTELAVLLTAETPEPESQSSPDPGDLDSPDPGDLDSPDPVDLDSPDPVDLDEENSAPGLPDPPAAVEGGPPSGE